MENLGIDLKLLIAQLINFAIFFFVFQKFISKPFLKYLKKQKEEDKLRETMAEELEKRQDVLEKKDKELERERKKALEAALADSKKQADVVRVEMIDAAKKEAASIVKKAEADIKDEREKLYKEIRQQIVSVSNMVVQKALKNYLTREAQEAITKNIIDHIPEDTKLTN